jgi:hypothetical protein
MDIEAAMHCTLASEAAVGRHNPLSRVRKGVGPTPGN